MLALIAFSLLFIISAFAASGTAKLIIIITQPGELFGAWQKFLYRLEPGSGKRFNWWREFWYKRLGACILCLRQFIAELSFILLCCQFSAWSSFPTSAIDNVVLRWTLNIAVFIAYCGTTLQLGQWMDTRNTNIEAEEPVIETQFPNQPKN